MKRFATLSGLSLAAVASSSAVMMMARPSAAMKMAPVRMTASVSTSVSAMPTAQTRAQSSLSPTAIRNVKGTPSVTFTPYKVYHIICKHDPKLRGRQGPHLMAIIYNKYARLTGAQLYTYKLTAAKLNRLRSLASQRLLLSSVVLRKFGVENYRRIYPNSSVTVGSASRAASKVVAASGYSAAAKKKASPAAKKVVAKATAKKAVISQKKIKKVAVAAKKTSTSAKKKASPAAAAALKKKKVAVVSKKKPTAAKAVKKSKK